MTSNVDLVRTKLREGWIPPVARLIGFRLTEIELVRAKIEFEAGPQHANPMGSLHGGILCDVADAAMGMAFASGLSPDETFTTIELKMNFLRPVRSARLVADGQVVKRGRRVGVLECRITDEQGDLVAYGTATCMTVPGTPQDGLRAHLGNGPP